MSDHEGGGLLSIESRVAWLELGGYVAGADGLSEQEAQELAGTAAGPEMSESLCMAAIEKGAKQETLPKAAVAAVGDSDIFVRVACLMEIYSASLSDGLSEPETARLRELARTMLGEAKVASFLRSCELQVELNHLLGSLVIED